MSALAATSTDWFALADAVAGRLAGDALERDRAGQNPVVEAQLLKDSGLVNAVLPASVGGGGASWSQLLEIVRRIARVDGSIAQLLAYHYVNANEILLVADAETQERVGRLSADGSWIWGDAVNPIDPDLTVEADGDGYVLNGRKSFATGASVGDVTIVGAVDDRDGWHVSLFVPSESPGFTAAGDWDNLGQRLSASGGVRFDAVRVAPEQVIARLDPQQLSPFRTLVTPIIQAAFGYFYVGVAEGALARAADYTREKSRAWIFSGVESASNDPYVLAAYGQLSASLQAAAALAEKAGRHLDEVFAKGHELSARERGEVAVQVAALKVVATDLSLDVTNRIFELTGARATSNQFGFDIYWRNVRTHTLHDPVAYKRREVGEFYLNDRLPQFSLYT